MQNEPTCLTSSHSAVCSLQSAFEKAPSIERNPTTPVVLGLLRPKSGALQQGGKLIQRAIPSSGEMLPALGLSFSNHPGCADHAVLTEILKTFADGDQVWERKE